MPSPTSSSSSPAPIHKSPIFWTLLGLSSFLFALSIFMVSKLEHLAIDDDMLLGSSGGDGLRNDGFELRLMQHRKRKRQRRAEEGSAVFGKGGPMEHSIANFAEWKQQEQNRRRKHNELSQREEFERDHPYGHQLKEEVQREFRVPDLAIKHVQHIPYDIYNCPEDPPDNYPYAWNVLEVLDNWNPDETDLPDKIHQGLCVFDWHNDHDIALNYRNAQVPYILQNVPQVMKAAKRWMTPGYLEDLLGSEAIRNEHSLNNHFMYWKTRHPTQEFEPPTDMVELTYPEWLHRAKHLQKSTSDQTDKEHWYFRLNAMFDKHGYVYEELPFFDPTLGESMTMIHPEEHRGINCRFGMKGVIAETHYDSSSNFIALMGGQRRYILAHPNQCENMELYPQSHPSGRHSSINWSTAYRDFANSPVHRPFMKARVNEVVLQAGDLMYLPTFWFHFIVSLDINYQCNSRSGQSTEYQKHIQKCGFATGIKG